jgi:predicted N-acetyltransferase YhbS
VEDLERNLLADPGGGPDLALAAARGDRLVGLAAAAVRSGDGALAGHIKVISVDPSLRRLGLGSALFERLEGSLRRRGVKNLLTDGAAPIYLQPGVPEAAAAARAFFEARGFRELEKRRSMTARPAALGPPPRGLEQALARDGYLVRRGRPRDARRLEREIAAVFPPAWAHEVSCSLDRSPPGTHLAFHQGRLAAFATAGLWARNAFGPMATLEEHAGRGLGELLLRRCFHDLAGQGAAVVVISWVGPETFYRRVAAAETTLRYFALEKSLR